MGKRFFKFTALISLIFFAINVDVLAEGDSDDHACPDGDQGPVISCGRYEGTCWNVDWISGIDYEHCYVSGMQELDDIHNFLTFLYGREGSEKHGIRYHHREFGRARRDLH